MATTYIAPTVKQFVDGAMVAFYDASATSAIEAAFESSTQTATSPVNDTTIAILGEAFSTSSLVTGNITADLQHAAVNLTGSQITVSGELNAFLAEYNQALADGFTGAQAEGITIASFTASTLGAVAGNLGLTPTDLTAFQTQQQAAINRSNVSGNYADSATPGSTLVPVTIGDAAWVASQNALVGVTSDPTTVTTQEAKITAAEAVTPNNPALITPIPQALTLTTGIDSPTQGFSTGTGGTATAAGAIFSALPVAGTLGLNNTLNTGDDLVATGAAAGTSILNVTDVLATAGLLANPPYATGVTLNEIGTLNISNQATVLGLGIKAGFQGSVTGLTTANDLNSLAEVQLGAVGQGLGSAAASYNALTNVNITGYSGPTGTAAPVFAAFINANATGVSTGANTINIGITGRLGGTAAAATATGAAVLQFANDSGTAGTTAAPDTTFGTWAITAANAANLELVQGSILGIADVGGATKLTLSGAGNIAVGQDAIGNWQNLKTIDASGETGTVVVTGATSGVASQAFATTGNPGWLFGSNAGLLDDTGTGGVFDLTSFKLGSGTNFLDVSSASVAQVAALTTTPGTHVALNNEIIVNDTVATTTSATTFGNIAGFEILGVAGAGGIINDAHLAGAGIDEILYQTAASGALTITNQTSALTVNTEDNGLGFAIKSTGAGLTDSFTLDLGNPLHNTAVPGSGAGSVGALTLTADSIVNINALGHTAGGAVITDTLGFVSLTPSLIGNEQVTISGTTNLTIGVFGAGGIQT